MSRTLVITAAGMSSRFSASLGHEVLKCIYADPGRHESILGEMLDQSADMYSAVVIVGGHRYMELDAFVKQARRPNITLVFNSHFSDYGSNYSLYLGLQKALERASCDEIVFAEGDLVLDAPSFRKVSLSGLSVLTENRHPIEASRSVAFYRNPRGSITYVYDPSHESLAISEPFTLIGNSGQVWKFHRLDKLKGILEEQTESDFMDSNLNIVQSYLQTLAPDEYEILSFARWHNCNTIEDYRSAFRAR